MLLLWQLRSHNNKPIADHYNYLGLLNKMAYRLIKTSDITEHKYAQLKACHPNLKTELFNSLLSDTLFIL